jgi:selenophosphate synthetase-related protein
MLNGEELIEMKAHPDFDTDFTIRNKVQAGRDTDVIRISDTEVRVLFANGGWLRLTSESPISAFIKPQE